MFITGATVFIVACAVFFVTIFPNLLPKEQPKEPGVAAEAVKTEIAEQMEDIGADTYFEMPSETADSNIEELEQLLTKSTDKDQIFELKRLQMTAYSNTNRAEKGVEIGEEMLAEGGLSEEQKLSIYTFMANSYVHQIKNPEQFEKLIELLQESVDLLGVPEYDVNVNYYRVRLSEQKAGVYDTD